MPAPQASRTVITMSSECWSAAGGIACAEEARAAAKASAINLIIGFLPGAQNEGPWGTAASQLRAEISYEQSGFGLKWRSGFPGKNDVADVNPHSDRRASLSLLPEKT
jgi:hypothetical protein